MWINCIIKYFMALGLDKFYEGDQIKKNEIDRASGR